MYKLNRRLRVTRRRFSRRLSKVVAAMGSIALVTSPACTRSVKVPAADYESVNPKHGPYLIDTIDGQRIHTDRFKVTETGFLIEGIIDQRARRKSVEPYAVPFDQVVSVTRSEISSTRTLMVMVPLTVAVVYVMLLAVALAGLEGT
jgi:hypothetical protein